MILQKSLLYADLMKNQNFLIIVNVEIMLVELLLSFVETMMHFFQDS